MNFQLFNNDFSCFETDFEFFIHIGMESFHFLRIPR